MGNRIDILPFTSPIMHQYCFHNANVISHNTPVFFLHCITRLPVYISAPIIHLLYYWSYHNVQLCSQDASLSFPQCTRRLQHELLLHDKLFCQAVMCYTVLCNVVVSCHDLVSCGRVMACCVYLLLMSLAYELGLFRSFISLSIYYHLTFCLYMLV